MEIAGKKINNWYVVGGVAGVGVAYYAYKKYQSNAASSSSTSSTASNANAIDPVTGLPYSEDNSIDPLTGMSYLQEAQQYGSVQAADQMVSSGSAYYNAGDQYGYAGDSGYPYGDVTSATTTTSTATTYQTNAQWASAVQAGLVGLGYSSEDVASALGLFFAQHPLSASQANIIQVAEAEFGPPPQGTYSIIPSPTTPGGSTVTVPKVTGIDLDNAHTELQKAGLTFNTSGSDAPGGRQGYLRMVTAQNPKAGAKVAKNSHVDLTWHYQKES